MPPDQDLDRFSGHGVAVQLPDKKKDNETDPQHQTNDRYVQFGIS